VRHGNDLVGDDDGVLVVASWIAAAVLDWAEEHVGTGNYVKDRIRAEQVAPGRHYGPTEAMKDEWLRVKK
jgi:regulator of RNase E activity RraA